MRKKLFYILIIMIAVTVLVVVSYRIYCIYNRIYTVIRSDYLCYCRATDFYVDLCNVSVIIAIVTVRNIAFHEMAD